MSEKVVGQGSLDKRAAQFSRAGGVVRRRTPSLPSINTGSSVEKKPTPTRQFVVKTQSVEGGKNVDLAPAAVKAKGPETPSKVLNCFSTKKQISVLSKANYLPLAQQDTAPTTPVQPLKNSVSNNKSFTFLNKPASRSARNLLLNSSELDKSSSGQTPVREQPTQPRPSMEELRQETRQPSLKLTNPQVKNRLVSPAQGDHQYYNYKHLKTVPTTSTHKKSHSDHHSLFLTHLKHNHEVLHQLARDKFNFGQVRTEGLRIRRDKSHLLVLDLDETLVHCCNFDGPEKANFQHVLNYKNDKGFIVSAKMTMRPLAREFLQAVSQQYDLAVYTASEATYAEAVVDWLDPARTLIKAVFSREHCLKTEGGVTVKFLPHILGLQMSSLALLVDNSPQCLALQPDRAIPILPFTYDEEDRELEKLADLLLHAKSTLEPIRFVNEYFCFDQYLLFKTSSELVRHLSQQSK